MVSRTLSRLGATGLAAVAALGLLAGCGKGGGGGSAGGGDNGSLTLWTHNAGNAKELAADQQVVDDFNKSQSQYKVTVQSFPQDSYNQSVTAAAASKKLPCILDVDGPNVPNWAWAGYLSPLTGMDDTLSKFLPSVVGKYQDKTYSFGHYDVALAMYARPSTLQAAKIRVPSIDKPWTAAEFASGLKALKATGKYPVVLDLATGNTGEWWPYAYSPFLQSFGGDLINRSDYKSADGALNGDKAVAWATWFRSLVTDGYTPLKSSADPEADFLNGKSAILYNGSWGAEQARAKLGKDVVFVPPPDFGSGPKIGGGSWQWAVSSGCGNQDGAMAFMKFLAQDKYVASISEAAGTIPATDAAAAMVKGYEPGGDNDIFRQFSKKFAEVRPPTPGYPFIATEFTKTSQDILNGADPKQALDKAVSDIDANQKSNNYFA
ncbi:ABC transporter substrate-binding protein [Nakamurella endophytica]|uniref:Sugar-binding protein n=1 Tax=Nakamurella endophytica TaxID=1748367 RepID=A0A917WEP1_9ACTN|nr:sugar ABC transporter substrate-binding protein [Nakamurella endophytica]GGL97696.1 sugar-binding protein [Nakamurella endophytica]